MANTIKIKKRIGTFPFINSIVFLFLLFLVSASLNHATDFISEQRRYERVRIAFQEKDELIRASLENYGININELNILIRVYKSEKRLEFFAKNKSEDSYQKINAYNICASSGSPGPKRKQGDQKVPEGFYHIDRFNPASIFFLSLGINYPNTADRRITNASDPGDNIFIHGGCVSIGCLAMTDDKIKEIYLYAIYAKQSGQNRIPVYIFPFEMTDRNMQKFKLKYPGNAELIDFWSNLKKGHDIFDRTKQELNFTITRNGEYIF